MDVSRRVSLCACAGLFVMAAGCVAPYPYSPYGGYPGQMVPGQYGTTGMISPAPALNSASNSPTPLDTSADSSGNDAPPFNPTEGTGVVPDYPDPGDVSAPSKGMFGGDQGAFDPDGGAASKTSYDREIQPKGAAPALQLAAEEPRLGEPTILPAKGEFFAPTESLAGDEELKAPYTEDAVQIPFSHEAGNYRSLSGLVSFDDDTQTWAIMYNDRPGRDDEYGGMFTLADDEGFGVLNENDVVYVEGAVSESERDAFGKPKYVVEHLKRLKPTGAR